jgi:hypothetical protein
MITSMVIWILFEFHEKVYFATGIVLLAFHFAWSSDLSDLVFVWLERKFLTGSLIYFRLDFCVSLGVLKLFSFLPRAVNLGSCSRFVLEFPTFDFYWSCQDPA